MSGIGFLVLGLSLAASLVVLALALARARRERRRFRVLAQLAHVSDRGGSLQDTLDAICEILVPELADLCAIDLISDAGPRRVAVRAGPGGGEQVAQGIAERGPSLPPDIAASAGGEPVATRFIERLGDEDLRRWAHDEEDLEFLRGIGVRSSITVALTARGRLTGALTISVAWSGRAYRPDDVEFAEVLSGRVALTLDNAGLFSDLERSEEARNEIARTLQQGLLPPPIPNIPGWSIAASYRPAGAENEVGGDFYDAFPASGGWMLVVGDVTGRGARAASVTAQARYTLRTAAALTGDPLVALATLNRALLSRGDSALCSVAALAVTEDPAEPIRLAVAGHPPPLLVAGDAIEELSATGPVLGAFDDARWVLDEMVVEPGQQLVVVTDGIAEAAAGGSRFGEERLRADLAGARSPTQAVQRLETSLTAFAGSVLDDDVAILALSPASIESRQRESLPIAADPLAAAGPGA